MRKLLFVIVTLLLLLACTESNKGESYVNTLL